MRVDDYTKQEIDEDMNSIEWEMAYKEVLKIEEKKNQEVEKEIEKKIQEEKKRIEEELKKKYQSEKN